MSSHQAAERDQGGLSTRDTAQRDPIRPMDKQALRAEGNTELASVEALPREPKRVEMRGGDFQERNWQELSDKQRVHLMDQFFESRLCDPKPPEVFKAFLDDVSKLSSEWRSVSAPEQMLRLQGMLDGLTRELEPPLPGLKVAIANLPRELKGYYENGTIVINRAVLNNAAGPAELAEALVHELAHGEQDHLIIRMLADDRQLGRLGDGISDGDLAAIRSEYRERTGLNITDDYVREVLRIRDGQRLDDDMLARADRLAESFKEAAPVRQRFDENVRQYMAIQQISGKLWPPGGIDGLMTNLALNPQLAADVLGPEADFILRSYNDQVRKGRKFHGFSLVERQIRAREERLGLEIYGAMSDYASSYHEQEGWFIGQIAGGQVVSHELQTGAPAPLLKPKPAIVVIEEGGISVTVDRKNGQVLETIDANGIKTSFEYGSAGQLKGVKRSDNTEFSTRDGKSWIEKNGDSLRLLPNTTFEVDEKGILWRISADGLRSWIT